MASPDQVRAIVDRAIAKTTSEQYKSGKAGEHVGTLRFINTRNYGVIDLKHVISAAHNPFSSIPYASRIAGAIVEYDQWRDGDPSAMQPSDFNSNKLGGEAAVRHALTSWMLGTTTGDHVRVLIYSAEPIP
jgi:hypothetical protein